MHLCSGTSKSLVALCSIVKLDEGMLPDSLKDGSPRVLLSGRVTYMSFVCGGAELFTEKVDFYRIMHSKASL